MHSCATLNIASATSTTGTVLDGLSISIYKLTQLAAFAMADANNINACLYVSRKYQTQAQLV